MNEPDLRLGCLSIWVQGRSFPAASDYWDANWLNALAKVQVGTSSVSTNGSILMTVDFELFRNELAGMYEALAGRASLQGYEQNLKVEFLAHRTGGISGKIEITPDHMTEFHSFEFELDQTFLPELVASCDALLERFPVLNRPGAGLA